MMSRLFVAIRAFFEALSTNCSSHVVDTKTKSTVTDQSDHSHLRLLSIMQNKGRLLDFLKEDISSFSDAQIGAAVRKIHEDCAKSLEDIVTLRPVIEEVEGDKVMVPKDYDPSEIKVVGNVRGKPPFEGILRHHGWKAHKISLPKQVGSFNREIVTPAEVEVL